MVWGIQWESKNMLDGFTSHLMFRDGLPILFKTKRETLERIQSEFGYIRGRKDLRSEPHGWRMPKPVRVIIKARAFLAAREGV